jgi:hypothetical protein
MIALLSIETYFNQGDAFDNVGFHQEVGLEVLYPSQWMLQASLVMAWPWITVWFCFRGLGQYDQTPFTTIARLGLSCTTCLLPSLEALRSIHLSRLAKLRIEEQSER